MNRSVSSILPKIRQYSGLTAGYRVRVARGSVPSSGSLSLSSSLCFSTIGNNSQVSVPPETRLSKDGVAGRPIDFDTQSKIEGNESQIVTITLEPGQVLRAESGGTYRSKRVLFARSFSF